MSCKNETTPTAPLHKRDLAPLYIDAQWIEERHPQLAQIIRIAHLSSEADEGLPTNGVRVLTTTGLASLGAAVRQTADSLAKADMAMSELEVEAERLLEALDLTPDGLLSRYCTIFRPRVPRPTAARRT